MSLLSKIKQDSKIFPQLFVLMSERSIQQPIHFTTDDIITDKNQAFVATIENSQYIIKLIKPRSWHEYGKLLWGHSRISKEVYSNKYLKEIGIQVPHICEYGIGLIPTRNYRYLGYYIMDNLDKNGLEDTFQMIKGNKLTRDSRQNLINNLYRDINNMLKHQVVFTDLKLSNIFSDKQGNLVWIDTGINKYHILQKKIFRKKFNFSLNRFMQKYESYLNQDEIQLLLSLKNNIT